jgi:transketolase
MQKSVTELQIIAAKLRMEALKTISYPGKGHIGGSMSIAETLAVLYGEIMNVHPDDCQKPDRDKLIFSKGHCGPILYAALAEFRFIPKEFLTQMNCIGTRLPSHVNRILTPGVDFSTGSLGQGLSVAAGMAYADQQDRIKNRYIYCILGDGECQEGQIWEAAMFASTHNLHNLIVLVDANKKQCSGYNDKIIKLEPIEDKFAVFGLKSVRINGHNVAEIRDSILTMKKQNRPSAIILDTVKGKDCVYAENLHDNHHISLNKQDLQRSLEYLQEKIASIEATGLN